MTHIITAALLIAIVPFSFALFVDVCFGKPAAEEFDRKAIFFGYSYFLAKLRLQKNGSYEGIYSTYVTNVNSKDATINHAANMELKRVVFETGREFFSWELGFGMCPICTNIRIAIVSAIMYVEYFQKHWILIILIPCFSNLYLLFFNKLKF